MSWKATILEPLSRAELSKPTKSLNGDLKKGSAFPLMPEDCCNPGPEYISTGIYSAFAGEGTVKELQVHVPQQQHWHRCNVPYIVVQQTDMIFDQANRTGISLSSCSDTVPSVSCKIYCTKCLHARNLSFLPVPGPWSTREQLAGDDQAQIVSKLPELSSCRCKKGQNMVEADSVKRHTMLR